MPVEKIVEHAEKGKKESGELVILAIAMIGILAGIGKIKATRL
jgi:hypothetical protein